VTLHPLPHAPPDGEERTPYVRRRDGVSSYTPELGAHICARIAEGESGAAICAGPDMPSKKTLHAWVRRHADFAVLYGEARARAAAEARRRDAERAEGRRWRQALAETGSIRGVPPARGRPPTRYSRALAEAVCERIEAGETPRQIGADPDMPSRATIFSWLRRRADFAAMYAEARARQAEAKFDLAWEIAAAATPKTVAVARLQCDVLRWQTAMLAPRKYGRPEPEPPEPVRVLIRKFALVDGEVVETGAVEAGGG